MARPAILFIRLGAIGDVVRTLPALTAVRRQLPEARLVWIVEGSAFPLLRGHPDLDEVVLLDRNLLTRLVSSPDTFFEALAMAGRLARDLRRERFSVSLDFQGTLKSGVIARAAGAPLRVGYHRAGVKEGNHLFNNRHVALPPPPVHRVLRNLKLLEGIGVTARAEEVSVSLPISRADRSGADRALAAAGHARGPFVFLYPGSSRRQSFKRYPPQKLGEVARRLALASVDTVVGSGPGEEDAVAAMRAAAGASLSVLPPTSLLEMAEVIGRASLFIGGDTGPMHMAAFLGVPVVALFGSTDPALNAPWGDGHVVLDAASRPARRRRDPSAFAGLTPERIAEAALRRLGLHDADPAALPPPPAPVEAHAL